MKRRKAYRALWLRLGGLVACALVALPLQAAWTSYVSISRIQATYNGTLVLHLTANHECGSTRLEPDSTVTAEGLNKIYAGLLAAHARGAQILVLISSCSGAVGKFTHIEG
jgi:hypothetical protein